MSRAVALVLLSACGHGERITFDGPPAQLELDVVVSADRVELYVRGDSENRNRGTEFVEPGACAGFSDIRGSEPTCLTQLAVDDRTVAIPNSLLPYAIAVAVRTDSTLAIAGCGGEVTIPLEVGALPTPVATGSGRGTETVTVAWTADLPFASALVDVNSGIQQWRCHVAGSEHVFDDVGVANVIAGQVQTFVAPAVHATALGTVRVWRGNASNVVFE